MSRADGSIEIGPLTLRPPAGHRLIAASAEPERVDALARSSPDRTVYHSLPYVEFMRREGVPSELVVLEKDGRLACGFLAHVETPRCFDGGFCGLLLPEGGDRVVRRGLAAMTALLDANPHLRRFGAIQSVLGRGGPDDARRTLVEQGLLTVATEQRPRDLFTRGLELPVTTKQARENATGELIGQDVELLGLYDGDVRNQIRQAMRNGLRARWTVFASDDADLRRSRYETYARMHGESWRRTGLSPHTEAYWNALSRAIVGAGGIDVIVQIFDGEDLVAGVTCHVYERQALYFSGGSTLRGQEQRANPLALHAAIAICRRLGVTWFEIGRFEAHEDEKLRAIQRYKSQFGGRLVRVPNLRLERLAPSLVAADEAWRLRYRMPNDFPRVWRIVGPAARYAMALRQR